MAIQIMLRHMGNGIIHVATPFDQRLACEKWPQGQAMWAKVTTPRSAKQNRWFHVMIRTAFENIPEDRAIDFPDADYLRDWALVKVGWAEHTDLDMETVHALANIDKLSEFISRIRGRKDKHVFVTQTPQGLRMSQPKTISFTEQCPQRTMNEITDRVLWLLERELRIPRGLLEPQIPEERAR